MNRYVMKNIINVIKYIFMVKCELYRFLFIKVFFDFNFNYLFI